MRKTRKRYVVYKLVKILDCKESKVLIECDFGFVSNSFETEKDAIKTIARQEESWINFIILTQIDIIP
jgi:hypothetical protein